MEEVKITKIISDDEKKITDVVTEEIPLTIFVNEKEIVTLLSSPENPEELAAGFLYSAGMLTSYEDISDITLDSKNWAVYVDLKDKDVDERMVYKRMFTSGCGKGTLFYNTSDLVFKSKKRGNVQIDRRNIFKLVKEFNVSSEGFKETGGVHSAVLTDAENTIVLREDIGRHNAIDKVLGCALINDIVLADKAIITSGRLSSEIVLKIAKTDISVLISRSAPTNQAVKHAQGADITLVGFARGERMNIYHGERRIK